MEHAKGFLEILDRTAFQFVAETRSGLAAEYEVIAEGLKLVNSVFHALVGYSAQDEASDDQLKSARTTIALRLSKTLQAAMILQERDMTADSLSLCRDALEAAFVWKYIEAHPGSALRWFDSTYGREDEFGFARVVRATGDYDDVYGLYQFLCKFCHATGMTFWTGLSIEPSDYSMGFRRFCCACILTVVRRYLASVIGVFAGRLFDTDDVFIEWQVKARKAELRLRERFSNDLQAALAHCRVG